MREWYLPGQVATLPDPGQFHMMQQEGCLFKLASGGEIFCTVLERFCIEESIIEKIPGIHLYGRNVHIELFRQGYPFVIIQATEHALRALLVSLTGLTAHGHNLKSLIRHSCFCAPDLDTIFPKNTVEEKELFDLLNTAYVSARYSPI